MINEILSHINWVDLVAGGIFVRCIYSGVIKGAVVELFKLIGMFFATLLSLHYYVRFAEFLHQLVFIPMSIGEPLALFLLGLLVVIAFKFIRDGLTVLLKAEAGGWVSKGAGGLLGLIRAALVGGLVMTFLFSTNQDTVAKFIRSSYSGSFLAEVSLKVYDAGYNVVVSNLFPGENKGELKFMMKEHGK